MYAASPQPSLGGRTANASQAAALASQNSSAPAPRSSSVLNPGGYSTLFGNSPSGGVSPSAPGIVPQVYPGSTGSGSNQNASTTHYGGFTPQPISTSPVAQTPQPSNNNWFWNLFNGGGGSSNTASAANALFGSSTPSATSTPAAPVYAPGTTENPAGSNAPVGDKGGVTTVNAGGKVGIETTTGATGDRASQLAAEQQKADMAKYFPNGTDTAAPKKVLDDAQAQRDAQNAALQAQMDQVSKDVTLKDNEREQALKDLMAKQAQNNQKSPEEEQAQAEIDNLQGSLGISTAELANQPIPIGFITGQQSALEKRVSALQAPISAKLARLQSQRQSQQAAALDVAKLNYEAAKEAASNARTEKSNLTTRQYNLQDKATTAAETRQTELQKPFSLSQGQQEFRYNPSTGKYEQMASVAPKVAAPKASHLFTNDTLPSKMRDDLTTDIVVNKGSLQDLYRAYPEISQSVIYSLFNHFNKSSSSVGSYTGK